MKVSQYILTGRLRLEAAGLQCADPLLHMKQLVQFALGWDSSTLYREWNAELCSAECAQKIEPVLQRRLAGEPFQYITGVESFWNSTFCVGPGVLIPRRETECLVETLLRSETRAEVRMAELGAGSGNIGISLLQERPCWEWHAYEKNADSLSYLKANRDALLPNEARYVIHCEDFFDGVQTLAPLHWIVSNPPYVSTADMGALSKEVAREPAEALHGGSAGVDVLTRILETAFSLLAPGGGVVLEMDYRQGDALSETARACGYAGTQIVPDYASLPRIFVARKG